jgi:hypothetical protein
LISNTFSSAAVVAQCTRRNFLSDVILSGPAARRATFERRTAPDCSHGRIVVTNDGLKFQLLLRWLSFSVSRYIGITSIRANNLNRRTRCYGLKQAIQPNLKLVVIFAAEIDAFSTSCIGGRAPIGGVVTVLTEQV